MTPEHLTGFQKVCAIVLGAALATSLFSAGMIVKVERDKQRAR